MPRSRSPREDRRRGLSGSASRECGAEAPKGCGWVWPAWRLFACGGQGPGRKDGHVCPAAMPRSRPGSYSWKAPKHLLTNRFKSTTHGHHNPPNCMTVHYIHVRCCLKPCSSSHRGCAMPPADHCHRHHVFQCAEGVEMGGAGDEGQALC